MNALRRVRRVVAGSAVFLSWMMAAHSANPTNCVGGPYDPPNNGGTTSFACTVSGNSGAISSLTLGTDVTHSFNPCINEHQFSLVSPAGTVHAVGTRNGVQSLTGITTFNTQSSNGVWTLRVADSNGNDACNDDVNAWSLTFTLSGAANPTVTFADTSLNENGAPPLRVRVTTDGGGATTGARSVDVGVDGDNSGSAVQGSDFTLSTATVTIPAGTASGSLLSFGGVIDDAKLERTETIGLKFSNSVGVTANTANHQISINDDESGTISFVNAASTVDESGSPFHSIPVRLTPVSSDGAAGVDLFLFGILARTSGTATTGAFNVACPNQDWSFFNDPNTFDDSQNWYLNASGITYTPRIRVCADGINDNGETIVMQMMPNGALPANVSLVANTHTVTITDLLIFRNGFE